MIPPQLFLHAEILHMARLAREQPAPLHESNLFLRLTHGRARAERRRPHAAVLVKVVNIASKHSRADVRKRLLLKPQLFYVAIHAQSMAQSMAQRQNFVDAFSWTQGGSCTCLSISRSYSRMTCLLKLRESSKAR